VSDPTYPLVDLTPDISLDMAPQARVDPRLIAEQLSDISGAITRTFSGDEESPGALSLSTVTVALTIGAEGGIWFVARGSAEAAITLTFTRSATQAAIEHAPTPADAAAGRP